MRTNEGDRLRGIRAIIVEDSFIVAESLASLLTAHGCAVVGKAANVGTGLLLAAESEYDVAVLDVRLGDEIVTAVARTVHERGRRIVYLTGYADLSIVPSDLAGHPILAKPVRAEQLIEAILAKPASA